MFFLCINNELKCLSDIFDFFFWRPCVYNFYLFLLGETHGTALKFSFQIIWLSDTLYLLIFNINTYNFIDCLASGLSKLQTLNVFMLLSLSIFLKYCKVPFRPRMSFSVSMRDRYLTILPLFTTTALKI